MTLTQQDTATTPLPHTFSEMEETTLSLPTSPNPSEERTVRRSSTISESEKDHATEKGESSRNFFVRRSSNVSSATLTNVRATSEQRSKSDPVLSMGLAHKSSHESSPSLNEMNLALITQNLISLCTHFHCWYFWYYRNTFGKITRIFFVAVVPA